MLSQASGAPTGIRTVRGDIPADELGFTLCHEHLYTEPAPRLRDGDDLLLDDETKAVEELGVYTLSGGGAIVDLTVREFGRNPGALRRISEASGVTVIATTGHVSVDYWDGVLDVEAMSVDDLHQEIARILRR